MYLSQVHVQKTPTFTCALQYERSTNMAVLVESLIFDTFTKPVLHIWQKHLYFFNAKYEPLVVVLIPA